MNKITFFIIDSINFVIGARKFLETLKTAGNKSLYKLELSQYVNREIITEINSILKKNAPKGGKKKRKKKS